MLTAIISGVAGAVVGSIVTGVISSRQHRKQSRKQLREQFATKIHAELVPQLRIAFDNASRAGLVAFRETDLKSGPAMGQLVSTVAGLATTIGGDVEAAGNRLKDAWAAIDIRIKRLLVSGSALDENELPEWDALNKGVKDSISDLDATVLSYLA
jgi:hypothetical protein